MSLEAKSFLEVVTERDIDLLFLEELHVSQEFREWVVEVVYGSGLNPINFIGAWHSLSHPTLGESDLVVVFEASDGSRKGILLENKVDAPPQSDQGLRYRSRGAAGVVAGDWKGFRTCILAPANT